MVIKLRHCKLRKFENELNVTNDKIKNFLPENVRYQFMVAFEIKYNNRFSNKIQPKQDYFPSLQITPFKPESHDKFLMNYTLYNLQATQKIY